MDSPENFRNSRIKEKKIQEFKERGSLRNGPPRCRAAVGVGKARPRRAEPQPAVVEAEVRSAIERRIGVLRVMELVASAVDPEIVHGLEAVHVREQHDADGERAKAELGLPHDLACSANRAAAMANAKLSRNNEKAALLLVAELLPHADRLGRLAEIVRAELAFAIVVEAAAVGLRQSVEDLLQRLAVGLAELLPARDGKIAFRTVGQFLLAVREDRTIAVDEFGEQILKNADLFHETLRLGVAGEITVGRFDFLVGVLIGDRQLGNEFRNPRLQFVATLVEKLGCSLVELRLVVGGLENGDGLEALGIARRDQCRGHRHHPYPMFSSGEHSSPMRRAF